MADNLQPEWITVGEYAKRTGRSARSIYRSIDRGTIQCRKPPEGQKGHWMVLYNITPDHVPDDTPQELGKVYSQEYVDLLKATIMELKADKDYLKAQLTLALEAAKSVPDDVPDHTPDHTPDDTPEQAPAGTVESPEAAPAEETPAPMAATMPAADAAEPVPEAEVRPEAPEKLTWSQRWKAFFTGRL